MKNLKESMTMILRSIIDHHAKYFLSKMEFIIQISIMLTFIMKWSVRYKITRAMQMETIILLALLIAGSVWFVPGGRIMFGVVVHMIGTMKAYYRTEDVAQIWIFGSLSILKNMVDFAIDYLPLRTLVRRLLVIIYTYLYLSYYFYLLFGRTFLIPIKREENKFYYY